MLLDLIRYLRRYLFCSRKAYARNACLVISASTLLKLLTVHLPISRAAWLMVAFASPFNKRSVNLYFWDTVLVLFGHLRPWVIFLCRQATLQVIILHNRGGWSHRIHYHYHQGCYDIWSSWESLQVLFPDQWLDSLIEFTSWLSSWQFSCFMEFALKVICWNYHCNL